MKILGIDPGGQYTGFGFVEWHDSHAVHLSHGVIQFSANLSLAEKLAFFFSELTRFFEVERPHVISVEKIFLGKNPDSAFKLGHLRAIALLVAQQQGCVIAEYAPRTVKKVVTGHGGAEKEHVRQVVFNLLNIESTARNDATDALALAICHGYKYSVAAVTQRLKEMEL